MTDLRLKAVLKSWVPESLLSFYRQFREPLRLPDRSEVVLFADPQILPDYKPRQDFSLDEPIATSSKLPVTLIATTYNEAGNAARWESGDVLCESRQRQIWSNPDLARLAKRG